MASKFNEFVLRRLNNPGHKGRGTEDTETRKEFKITFTHRTYLALGNSVRIGPGLYGSAVTELAVRLLLVGIGMDTIPQEQVVEHLALAIFDRKTFAARLHEVARGIEEYDPIPGME